MATNEYLGKTDWLFITQLLRAEYSKYVKAIEGMGLSANDFTNELKTKLDDIDTSLYARLVSPIFTGTPTVPTAPTGDNGLQIANTSFVVKAISDALSKVSGISFSKVSSMKDLPDEGGKGVIYLVPNKGSGTNTFDEYYWDGTKYELFGTTAIDLSDYLKKTDVVELSTDEVKAVWDSVFTS